MNNNKKPLHGMYYRRKVMLALLDAMGSSLSKTDLQKLLFLLTRKQEKPVYDFMPYRFGCFSAQANQDLHTLVKYEFIKETAEGWQLTSDLDFQETLNTTDRKILTAFTQQAGVLRGDKLIHFVYTNYPEYAIKSEIAEDILTPNELLKIKDVYPEKAGSVLYTIGYEGKTVEKYINELIHEDVKVLCDVRKNPFSMKYGFSKKNLKTLLGGVGIEYFHLPGLGISSDERKNLKSASDYQILFEEYKRTTLRDNENDLQQLVALYKKKQRIALTCFEADHKSCHRSHTAESVKRLAGEKTTLVHL